MTVTMPELDRIVEQDLQPVTGSGPMAHIVRSMDENLSPQAYVFMARVEGVPLVALCGHIFLPNRDATKLPKCQMCIDLFNASLAAGASNEPPDAA